MITLADITLTVEGLILPKIGPDKMLLDKSVMGASGASLSRNTEQLHFAISQSKSNASHTKFHK